MALESFYGGKPGLSSVIKKAFRYISRDDPAFKKLKDSGTGENTKQWAIDHNEVMEECFRKNSYEEVWYGELCIINTYNKSNPANGCLFRRTLIRQGSKFPTEIYHKDTLLTENLEALSAEYIGQIVGPKGATPFLRIGDLEFVDAKAEEEVDEYTETRWEKNVNNEPKIVHNEQLVGENGLPPGDTWRRNALAENIFIPGKNYTIGTPENNYQDKHEKDKILYNWFDIDYSNNIDKDEQGEGWAYLGLSIPFFQADYNFENINYWEQKNPIELYNDERLFYKNWTIFVPRGVRGNAATKIGITTLREMGNTKVFQTFDAIINKDSDPAIYQFNEDANKVNVAFIRGQIGIPNDTKDLQDVPFYYCEYTIYNSTDLNQMGQSKYFYLGLVKHIDSFTLGTNGVITAHYSDATMKDLEHPLIWITSLSVTPANDSEDPGVLTVEYNNPEATKNWKKRFELILPSKISYDDNRGQFTITNTNGSSYSTPEPGRVIHPKKIEYNDSTGTFRVINNTADPETGAIDYDTNTEHPIEYVKTIKVAGNVKKDGSDALDSKGIKYSTNLHDELVALGDDINYIQEFVKHTDGHLYVLFNSPRYRHTEPGPNYPAEVTDENGIVWKNNVLWGYSKKLYWRDYGLSIGYHKGLYIGKNIPLRYDEENDNYIYVNDESIIINNAQDIIDNILDIEYPQGFNVIQEPLDGTLDRRGMLAVAQMKSTFYKEMDIYDSYYFAYDYDKKKWFLIQKIVGIKMTGGFYIKDGDIEIEADNSYANLVEYNKIETSLPAPWEVSGSYVFNAN